MVLHLTQSSHIGQTSWLVRSRDPPVFAYSPPRARVTDVQYHTRLYVGPGGPNSGPFFFFFCITGTLSTEPYPFLYPLSLLFKHISVTLVSITRPCMEIKPGPLESLDWHTWGLDFFFQYYKPSGTFWVFLLKLQST